MKRLADLEGRWRVTREVDDRRAGLTGRFEGEAVWAPDAEGLIQTEEGVLSYGTAPPMQATRRYLWREEGGALRVFFEDGRAFHTVPKAGQVALHDCPPDIYRVRYTFDSAEVFTTIWHVTGPRKDAVLTTHFTKVNGVNP
ncbi:DUF6314 family protein [Gymnodinialimonas sp.]